MFHTPDVASGATFVGSLDPFDRAFNPDGRPKRDVPLSVRFAPDADSADLAAALGLEVRKRDAMTAMGAVALALDAEARGRGRWVSLPRNKAHDTWREARRYRSACWARGLILPSVDRLADAGLIEQVKPPQGSRGRQTVIRATPDLSRRLAAAGVAACPPWPSGESIRLRERGGGALLDYRDNRETERMRRDARQQNEAIRGANIEGAEVTPLHRSFSGNFEQGGRFFAAGGGWQIMPKDARQRIRIDGESVVELDYSELHARLAYAEAGLHYPGGAYDLPGWPRPLAKLAFMVALNAATPHGAASALAGKAPMLAHVVGDEWSVIEAAHDAHVDERLSSGREPLALPAFVERRRPGTRKEAHRLARLLLDALQARHAPIAAFLCSDAGVRLQRADAEIAALVMAKMRARGVVVLPVHDSFQVPASKADLLRETMVEAFEIVTGRKCSGFDLVSEA